MSKINEAGLPSQAIRLFKLVALIAESPGIDPERLKDALEAETGRTWGTSTFFKDIRILKDLGVLEEGAHRTGYYLVGASFSDDEMKLILNALRVMGVNLRSPGSRELYERLLKRMAKSRSDLDVLSYPVEAVANRVSIETLSEDFHELTEALRPAIRSGQEVLIRKVRDPWKVGVFINFRVYPMQLIFHDTAWYLLAEEAEEKGFKIFRLDRLSPIVEATSTKPRGSRVQQKRLQEAKALLRLGWGMALPDGPEGMRETSLVAVEVWFDAYAANFLRESPRMHPTQEMVERDHGEIVFRVRLPDRALVHFERWVAAWGAHAWVRSPESLRLKMKQQYEQVLARYHDQA